MRRIILVISFILLYNPGKSQVYPDSIRSPWYFGAGLHYGFIIPHVKELKDISDRNIWGFQFDVSRLSLSKKAWSNCNCYYRLGFSFDYFNYRNPDVLGNSYNLILFFEPYFNFRSSLKFSLRGGMGLTYLNQVYDAETNPENLFYSAPVSGILLLGLSLNYGIKDNYQFKLGFNYNHISNGGLKMPNKGMNFPTVSLGMHYILHPVKLTTQPREPGLLHKNLHPYSRFFWTMRTVDETENFPEVKRIMVGIEGGVIKGISNINGFLIGLESVYDASYKELDNRLDEDYSPFVLSLHAGHVFVIGKITFTQQMAWYTFASYPDKNDSFFQRYGIYYRIGKVISAGFSLKAHGHVAEHMDLRLGLQF